MSHEEGNKHMNGALAAKVEISTALDETAEIIRLSKLDLLAYERERMATAARLEIRPTVLDKLVTNERRAVDREMADSEGQGRTLSLPPREPWPEPVNGAEMLDEITREIRRYVVISDDSAAASALWTVASYDPDAFYIFPRLFVSSAEKRCGKSTMLDVIECMTNKPLVSANIRSAALFRSIEMARPTMILDEADTFLRDDEDLRGVVNSGHKRNGAVIRCVGDDAEPRSFSTFCPMVIAGIGRQHETIEDRCILVMLRRKRFDETVESFRPDKAPQLERLARMAARFVEDAHARLAAAEPVVPHGVYNRMADNWRPLLAVADIAGGRWPELARRIAETMAAAAAGDNLSNRLLVLSDIRDVFAEKGEAWLASAEMVEALVAIEGRPWAEWNKGRAMTTNSLARLLAPHGIGPGNRRVSGKVLKGYKLSTFADAFDRYLPSTPFSTATPLQSAENLGFEGVEQPLQQKPCSGWSPPEKPQFSAGCSGVADENPLDGHVDEEDAIDWRNGL